MNGEENSQKERGGERGREKGERPSPHVRRKIIKRTERIKLMIGAGGREINSWQVRFKKERESVKDMLKYFGLLG